MPFDGSYLIQASIWQDSQIVSDVWFDETPAFNLIEETKEVLNYYLSQMNFMGNLIDI